MRQIFMKKRRLSGSFTLEAALVMPVVLFVIFGVITFSLWERDMLTMQAKMIESVQASRYMPGNEAEQILEDGRAELLYSSFGVSHPAKINGTFSTVIYGRPFGIFEKTNLHFSGTVQRKDYNPVSFLRKCNLVQTLIGK